MLQYKHLFTSKQYTRTFYSVGIAIETCLYSRKRIAGTSLLYLI